MNRVGDLLLHKFEMMRTVVTCDVAIVTSSATATTLSAGKTRLSSIHKSLQFAIVQKNCHVPILSSRHQTINFSSFLLKSKHYKPKNISVSLILLNTELHVLTVDQIRY